MDDCRFIIESNAVRYVDGEGAVLAEATFPDAETGIVEIDRTFVDNSLRGQGIAGKLLEHVALALEETGRQARPTCSYAARWFERHPERCGLLAP